MLNGEEEKSTSVEFSMFLDMLVVETGDLVWSSRAFIHSNTTAAEVFGLSEGPSVNELAQKGVIQLADELVTHLTDNRELELEQIFEQQKEETKMATEEAKDIEAEKTQEANEGNAEEILLKVKPK
jgi:hypothetical protein